MSIHLGGSGCVLSMCATLQQCNNATMQHFAPEWKEGILVCQCIAHLRSGRHEHGYDSRGQQVRFDRFVRFSPPFSWIFARLFVSLSPIN